MIDWMARSDGWVDRLVEAFGEDRKTLAETMGFDKSVLSRGWKGPTATRVAETLATVAAQTGYRIEWIVYGEEPRKRTDYPTPRDAAAAFASACRLDPRAVDEVDETYPDPNIPDALDRFRLILRAHQLRVEGGSLTRSV